MSETIKIIRKLNEEYLYDDFSLDKSIEFVAKALGKSINQDSYEGMTEKQKRQILNSYKEEYNNSGISKYVVFITIYNENTNVFRFKYLPNDNPSNSMGEIYDAALFDSEEEAKSALSNYKTPEGYTIQKYEIEPLKFDI